jgi:ABC-type spermidine/putrescine transport system permease subunit I
MMILGRNGALNQILIKLGLIDRPLKLMFNSFGVTVGMVHILLPLMILSLYSVMTGIDRDLLKAAQNLGARPFTAFKKIYFPLSMPGVAAGTILVFILSMGFFITPALLGGPQNRTIVMIIDTTVSHLLDWEFGSAASFILLFLIIGAFLISGKLIGFHRIWGQKT